MKRLSTGIAALVLGMGSVAMAQAPSSGTPSAYHVGEASCTFSIQTATGPFGFFGVPVDAQHTSQCLAIIEAYNANRAISWEVFPASDPRRTVPCEPQFCDGINVATRITNLTPVVVK